MKPAFEGSGYFRLDQKNKSLIGTVEGICSISETLETGLLARSFPHSFSWRIEKQISNDLQGDPTASSLFSSLGNALPWNIGFDRCPFCTATAGVRAGTHLWIHRDTYTQVFGSVGVFANKRGVEGFFQSGVRYAFKKRHSLRADIWTWGQIDRILTSLMYSYDMENGSTISAGTNFRKIQGHETTPFYTLSYSVPL